jgi:hypothetical protein
MDLQALWSQFFQFCTCSVFSITQIKESIGIRVPTIILLNTQESWAKEGKCHHLVKSKTALYTHIPRHGVMLYTDTIIIFPFHKHYSTKTFVSLPPINAYLRSDNLYLSIYYVPDVILVTFMYFLPLNTERYGFGF